MKNESDLFDQIEQQQDGDNYGLARQVASGEQLDAKMAADRLHYSNTSSKELKSLVATIKKRQALRDELENRRPQVIDAIAERRAEIDRQNDLLEEATAKHQSICRPLQFEIRAMEEELRRLAEIPEQLRRECPDKSLEKSVKVQQAMLNGMEPEYRELQEQMRRATPTACRRAEVEARSRGTARTSRSSKPEVGRSGRSTSIDTFAVAISAAPD